MVSFVNSHPNATSIGWHMWEIDFRLAPELPPGWFRVEGWQDGVPVHARSGSATETPFQLSLSLIPTTIFHKYSGSMKITTHLDHFSHCETTAGTNWSNRWTYRVFIIHTGRD